MIQVEVNPVLNEMKVAEIDYKSVIVQFLGFESKCYGPTVPVQSGAFPAVERLTMRERDIPIGLATSDHESVGLFLILGGVGNIGESKGFFTFDTGAAFPAVDFFASVARPCEV